MRLRLRLRLIGLIGLLACQSVCGQFTKVLPSQEPPTNSLAPGDLLLVTKYPGTGSEHQYKIIFTDFFNWLVTSGLVDSNKLTSASNGLNAHIATVENAATALATRAANLEGATNGLHTDVVNLQRGTNAPPLVNSFVFAGSSLTAESSAHAGVGEDWPQLLLQQPNYAVHGPSYNFGVGGSTAPGWLSSYWSAGPATVAPAQSNRTIIFMEFGVNDTGSTTITNDLNTLWSMARSSNYLVAALTVATNANLTSDANKLWWTNINIYIRSQSARWDYLVDVAPLLTNGATQLNPDQIHWTNLFHKQFVAFVNTNLPPPLSSNWAPYSQSFSSPIFNTITATNAARLNSIYVQGPSTTASDAAQLGAGLQIYDDGFTAQFVSGLQTAAGFTYQDYVFSGANVSFIPHSGARVVINGGPFEVYTAGQSFFDGSNTCVIVLGSVGNGQVGTALNLGLKNSLGALAIRHGDDSGDAQLNAGNLQTSGYITNTTSTVGIYFATNNSAANGSLYLDANGILWKRTNSAWVIR